MDYDLDGYISGDELSKHFHSNVKHNQKQSIPNIQQENNISQESSEDSSSSWSGLLDFITPSQNTGGAIQAPRYIPNNVDLSTSEAQKSLRDCVNTNVIRNEQTNCKSVTNILGGGTGKDLGQSGAYEEGIFYSETCRKDGTKELVRGRYRAGELGVGLTKNPTATYDKSDRGTTMGTFNGGWRGALNGAYTNKGATYSNKAISLGVSYVNTADNAIQGLIVDLSFSGGRDIGAFYRGGYGETYNEEVYRNGTWVPISSLDDFEKFKKNLPDSTPSYYDENNYK